MASTAKSSLSLGALSTKLSLASLAGIALLPVLPETAARRASDTPVEVVRSRPVALAEPSAPAAQPVAIARAATKKESSQAPEKPEPPVRRDQPAADAPPAKPATDAPPTDQKSEDEAPLPPPPDVWTEAEIIDALKECVRVMATVTAEVDMPAPVKSGQCGTPAPVTVHKVGAGTEVSLGAGATMNCRMVAALDKWVAATLQPAAREMLGSPVVRITGASSYNCRNRYNSDTQPLSEHAFGNAIDIAGFVTADGRTVDVAKHWGLTARQLREKAKEKAAATAEAKKDETPAPSIGQAAQKKKDRARLEKTDLKKAEMAAAAAPAPTAASASSTTEAAFLRRLHRGACGIFGTVLGPEANDAHNDHFHFDLAKRRRSSVCH